MNRFLALVLLANLVFAHLPSTPASLRRSAAHKRRLDDPYLPSTAVLHRRLSIHDLLKKGDNVQVLGQSPDGSVSAVVNGVTATLPANPVATPPPSSSTPSPSGSPASTPPPSSPSSGTSSSSGPVPPSSGPSPSPSETRSHPDPDPAKLTSQGCGPLGLLCSPSSSQILSSTGVPPSPSTSDPPQTSQPPLTSSTPPPSTTGDSCLLLGVGCLSSSSQPPPASSGPVSTQPPPSSTTGDQCLLLGVGCPPSSTPPSSGPVSSQPPSTNTPPPSSTGDQCLLFGIGCFPSSSPPSSSVPTQSPPSSTSGDQCLLSGVGCPPSSTSSEPPQSTQLSISTNLPPFTPPASSEPSSTTGASLPHDSSISIPSTVIIFPSESSGLPSPSTPNSLSTASTHTSAPTPTNTQFQWLTQTSLIFSSISESSSGSLSLTDPDQVPTATSFSTAGTPSVAPSVVPLPSGIPARIIPGAGGVNPEVDDLNGFTLIAILFDRGLNWDTVVHNPDSPGQIFSWLPVLIQTALGVTSDQVKSFALQVWVPKSYEGPSDISQLGTTWLGYIPTLLVETLAAQIKVRSSLFYVGQPPPYSDLASHVNPSFDIMTVTATTGIPGSGGSKNGSSGGALNDSRTRENAIIGVVSALGGITLIILGYLIYRAVQKRRELAHRRLSDPPTNPFIGEAPPNRNFDQDSIGGQRRRSFYFAEDSLRGFSDNYTNDDARLSPEQASGLNRRPIAGNIGPPVMRENSLNF